MEILLIGLACLIAIGISLIQRSDYLLAARRRGAAGTRGELRVGEMLDVSGGQDRLDDIVVVSPYRKSAQIDHVVRGPGNLIVIETKNWSGVLSGGPEDEHWFLRKTDGQVARLRNPLSQADRQARIVAENVGPGIPVERLVVMAGRLHAESDSLPAGVILLRDLNAVLPAMLDTGRGNPDLVAAAWSVMVEDAFSEEAASRVLHYKSFIESRFGSRPWHSWLIVAFAFAALSWTMALCLRAIQMRGDGQLM